MDRLQSLKDWWNGITKREQQLVLVMSLVVGVTILYLGIWKPITQAEENAQQRLNAQTKTLDYVKMTANQIEGLKKNGTKQKVRGSLSTLVTQGATQYNIEITRLNPQGKNLQIQMDDEVEFDNLMAYLGDLVQAKGLSLKSLDLAEGSEPGMVKVRRIQLSQL